MKKQQQFEILTNDKVLSSEFTDLISDRASLNRYTTFKHFLKTHNYTVDKNTLNAVKKRLEKQLYTQLLKVVVATYVRMELSREWGKAGEQQVKLSFSRFILGLAPEVPFEFDHLSLFDQKLQTLKEKYDLKQSSIDALDKLINHDDLVLLKQHIPIYKHEHINLLLTFMGSKLQFFSGMHTKYPRYMLYHYHEESFENQRVIWIEKELIRSPNIILALAAFNGKRDIYLRQESLEVIFDQKWCQIFRYNSFDYTQINYSKERQHSEGIKWHTLKAYGTQSEDALKAIKDSFTKDMGETILYHEVGHVVIQHDTMPYEVGAITEATKPYPDNIYMNFLEILADFAPDIGVLKGAIANMVAIHKDDPKRAESMFYMYLSDTWFYDTEDTYMYTYSDCIMLILLRYIQKDLSIDFIKLENDLKFDPKTFNPKAKPNGLIEILMKILTTSTTLMKNLIESSTFNVNGTVVTYKQMNKAMTDYIKDLYKNIDDQSYEFTALYWRHILHQLKTFSPNHVAFEAHIEKEKKSIMKKLFQLTHSKALAEKENFNHRKFIMERLSTLKLTKTFENE